MKSECSELRRWEEGRASEDGGRESEGAQQEGKGRWAYRGSVHAKREAERIRAYAGGVFCTHTSGNGRDLSMHGG